MFVNTLVKNKASSDSTLTNAYSANTTTFNIERKSQLIIDIEYTPGQNNGVLEIKFESGQESTDLHEKISQNSGSSNITIYQTPYKFTGALAGTTYKFEIPIDISNIWGRISFKETATTYGTINYAIVTSGEI